MEALGKWCRQQAANPRLSISVLQKITIFWKDTPLVGKYPTKIVGNTVSIVNKMGARVEIGAAEEIVSPIEAMLSFVKCSEGDPEER